MADSTRSILDIAIIGAAHPHVEYVLSEIAVRADVRIVAVADHDAARLVELEGLPQVEAARRLGVPISTMKARVQRGRSRLRELVEACCAIGLDARGHVIEVTPRPNGCACPA